jgi:hypothetical protein
MQRTHEFPNRDKRRPTGPAPAAKTPSQVSWTLTGARQR